MSRRARLHEPPHALLARAEAAPAGDLFARWGRIEQLPLSAIARRERARQPAAVPAPATRPVDAWAPGTLRLLLVMTCSGAELAALLDQLESGACADSLQPAYVADRLCELARARPRAPVVLGEQLRGRLSEEACGFEGRPMAALATLWSRQRDHMAGREIAALLWSIAGRSGVEFRKLEDRVVADIELMAARSFGRR